MAFLKIIFVLCICAVYSASSTTNIIPDVKATSCSITSISVDEVSETVKADIRYSQYALEDLTEGCKLYPKDLEEAINSFNALYTLHTAEIEHAPSKWSVAVDAAWLDIPYATHWVTLKVSHINGHSSVPVVIFGQ